jgi:hypothetical protein
VNPRSFQAEKSVELTSGAVRPIREQKVAFLFSS